MEFERGAGFSYLRQMRASAAACCRSSGTAVDSK